MRILIYEPEYGGHRLSGVRVLIDALSTLESSAVTKICLATTRAAPESDEFQIQLGDVSDLFDIEFVDDFGLHSRKFLKVAYKKTMMLVKLAQSGHWDHIYVPYGDGLVQVSSVLSFLPGLSVPKTVFMETILMSCAIGYPSGSKFQKFVQANSIRFSPFNRIHLIDPISYGGVSKKHPKLLDKLALLPDPISETPVIDKAYSRDALGLPAAGRCVGLVGRIDARKGADLLLASFLGANLDDDDYLLLAGKHSAPLANQVRSNSSRKVYSIDRYLTEEEMFQAIGAMDVVATPYRDSFVGSVSIVLRAAGAEKFCLGSNAKWMSYVIPRFKLGIVCDTSNPEVFGKYISDALSQSSEYESGNEAGELIKYGKIQNIRLCWVDAIKERLGLQTVSQEKLDWPEHF